ncbi:ADP-ribose pyrophosphatase [Microbacterium mangrovi]|uniref:ADP-ribose pyrophosphatase n=1 Tax=Microbacterium mangrovi TaxID=1348253 RepID=A0A0B2A7M5_9MICO|nr:NUDIX hydrolase [Microbacterium mangrovi]KHK99105.1 ADP-ribose pyrophosphatase [Microbacterium mangrovi]
MTNASVAADLRDEPFEPTVLESTVAMHGRVWDIRRDVVAYGDGELVREWMVHPGAVAIVAVDDDQRVLLIQQYRHPLRHRDWEVPAGLLDIPGEDPLEAAKRELAEEADLEATDWEPLTSIWSSPGSNSEIVHIYLARGVTTLEAFAREAEEADIRAEWVPLDAAVDAVMGGRMHNGILVAGILAAARRLQA